MVVQDRATDHNPPPSFAAGSPASTRREHVDLLTVVTLAAAAAITRRSGDCHCGISVVSNSGVPDTIASTSDVPARFDWLLSKLGQGPGATPVEHGSVLCVPDLQTDARWPEFGPLCASVVGVRSLLRVDIPVDGSGRAAMSLYCARPGVFGSEHVPVATQFARFAAAGVQQILQAWDAVVRRGPMDGNRLASALGIVMGRYRLTAGGAYGMLRDSAAFLEVGILELAEDVVRTGRLPAREIDNARRRLKERASHSVVEAC